MGKLVKNGIDYTNGTVDSALDNQSKNPVQNKVVTRAVDNITTTIGDVNTILENMLGMTLEDVTVTPSTSQQTVTAGEGYDGIGTVTVEAVSLENKTVAPSTSQQTITAGANYNGIGTVTVGAVTSAIDSDIVAGNIKKDVTILGVTGTYEGSGGASYKNVLIGLLDGSIETLDIPDGTTFIRSGSCVMLENLIHVTIPNTVEEIEHNAFAGCTKLETIEIDNYEDEIDDAPWGATNATVTWLR